jgi:hypothetical protein
MTNSTLDVRLHSPCRTHKDETIASFETDERGYRLSQKIRDGYQREAESDPNVTDVLIIVVRTNVPAVKKWKEAT